jgi:hypothetical protein
MTRPIVVDGLPNRKQRFSLRCYTVLKDVQRIEVS